MQHVLVALNRKNHLVTAIFFVILLWIRGASRGGAVDAIAPLKPRKVTLFTIILYNSENSIRDIRPFRRPLFITTVL